MRPLRSLGVRCKRLTTFDCLDLAAMTIQSPFAALLRELPQNSHTVSVLGSNTRYWTYGADDAPVTIVICHGYRGEHHGLEPVIAHLRGIRVIGPDLPGFGESTPLTEAKHDIDGYSRWFGKFVEALDLDSPPIILGHSFGSVVTSFAVADGHVFAPKLLLVNPIAAPATSGPNGWLSKGALLFYRSTRFMGNRLGSWVLGNWLTVQFMSVSLAKTKDRALRRWIHDQHQTYFSRFASREMVVESFEASVSRDVSEVGSRIEAPTLLIGAELDLITPVSALEALQRDMPNATLHVVPGVGHLIHYEKAEIAARHIVEFLGEGQLASAH